MDLQELTPIQKINNIYIKRDDFFEFAGCNGSKVRSALYIIQKGIEEGFDTFVSVGSRFSPQCEIISNICEKLGCKCYLFMPNSNTDTSIIKNIRNNKNTFLIRDLKQGAYTNVLIARSKKFAEENNYYYIPFGMECFENIAITSKQVKNLPKDINRIVVAVGSGMNYVSIINGLQKYNRDNIEVIGIQVGKDPTKLITKYCPMFKFLNHKIVNCNIPYEKQLKVSINNIELDPIYEAKCINYLQPNDLFWIVGHRKL